MSDSSPRFAFVGCEKMMGFKGIRTASGAAALAVAAIAGSSANAAITDFTVIRYGVAIGTFQVDSNPFNSYYGSNTDFDAQYTLINPTGYFQTSHQNVPLDSDFNNLSVSNTGDGISINFNTRSYDNNGNDSSGASGDVDGNFISNGAMQSGLLNSLPAALTRSVMPAVSITRQVYGSQVPFSSRSVRPRRRRLPALESGRRLPRCWALVWRVAAAG